MPFDDFLTWRPRADAVSERSDPPGTATLAAGDALDAYADWPAPTVIVSDGPYGIGGYAGDPPRPDRLATIYEPHAAAWAARATAQTSLWFWCSEIGWAMSHPALARHGWLYRGCNVWDKGVGHIAGNCNGKTMRKFPVVTELCVHYAREPVFRMLAPPGADEPAATLQDWFRAEWKRTGLPYAQANAACGVKNAATRKYLTPDHLWYPPPPEVFARLACYANQHGDPAGRPYFGLSRAEMADPAIAASKWQKTQAKFNFEYGVTNVWACPANRGRERLKIDGRAVHANQKPVALLERILRAASDPGDVIWDPFCGTGAVALTAARLGRHAYAAEIDPAFQRLAAQRIADFAA